MSRSRSGRQAARLGRAYRSGRHSWRAVRRMVTVEKLTAFLKESFPIHFPHTSRALLNSPRPALVFKVNAR